MRCIVAVRLPPAIGLFESAALSTTLAQDDTAVRLVRETTIHPRIRLSVAERIHDLFLLAWPQTLPFRSGSTSPLSVRLLGLAVSGWLWYNDPDIYNFRRNPL